MAEVKQGRQIKWYRTPVDRQLLRQLSQRSNTRGALQSLGFLGIYLLTLSAAFHAATHWSAAVTAALVFLHGMVASFMINAVHELGHNTVFRSAWLNTAFVRLFAFLPWLDQPRGLWRQPQPPPRLHAAPAG